jgi:hypothetical protein
LEAGKDHKSLLLIKNFSASFAERDWRDAAQNEAVRAFSRLQIVVSAFLAH